MGFKEFNDILAHVLEDPLPADERGVWARDEHDYVESTKDSLYKTPRIVFNSIGSKGEEVLDVGAAPGYELIILRSQGYSCCGVGLDMTSAFVNRMNRYHIPVHECDIEEKALPFADARFDMVTLLEVFEHLYRNPEFALRELNRVAKEGGKLVIPTPNLGRLPNRLRLLIGRSMNWPLDGGHPYYSLRPHDRHHRLYTKSELISMLRRTGFEVKKAYSLNPSFGSMMGKTKVPDLVAKALLNLLSNLIPDSKDTIVILASKVSGRG